MMQWLFAWCSITRDRIAAGLKYKMFGFVFEYTHAHSYALLIPRDHLPPPSHIAYNMFGFVFEYMHARSYALLTSVDPLPPTPQ